MMLVQNTPYSMEPHHSGGCRKRCTVQKPFYFLQQLIIISKYRPTIIQCNYLATTSSCLEGNFGKSLDSKSVERTKKRHSHMARFQLDNEHQFSNKHMHGINGIHCCHQNSSTFNHQCTGRMCVNAGLRLTQKYN